MTAIIIRNLPGDVHAALKRIAVERHLPVETLVRETLSTFARQQHNGIDFEKLARDRQAMGLHEDGPDWPAALDAPSFSGEVLGLRKAGRKTGRASAK